MARSYKRDGRGRFSGGGSSGGGVGKKKRSKSKTRKQPKAVGVKMSPG